MTPRDTPKSAGDLRREYEEVGRDRDGLVEKIGKAMWCVRERREGKPEWGWDSDCSAAHNVRAVFEELAEVALGVVERERQELLARAEDAEEKHRYWHERYDREVSALRERTGDSACSDPTCSYRAELAFQRERPRLTAEEAEALLYAVGVPVGAKDAELFAKLRRLTSSTTEKENPTRFTIDRYSTSDSDAWEEETEKRPPLTEEEAAAVVQAIDTPPTKRWYDVGGFQVALAKLRALASSATEERYEAAERLRRRQDDPRTQERSLSAWREEDEFTTEEQER